MFVYHGNTDGETNLVHFKLTQPLEYLGVPFVLYDYPPGIKVCVLISLKLSKY